MRVENNRKNKPKSFLFLPPPPTRDDVLSSHRSSVTLYLNTLLSTVSQIQIKQQEMRVNRQLEKRTMQGGLGGGGIGMQLAGRELAEKSLENGKGKGRAVAIGEVPAIYRPLPSNRPRVQDANGEGPIEATAEQILQFEAESTLALQSTLSDLTSLRQAETSLLEISALQSQLSVHLSQQTELSDKLWEESTTITGLVEGGNVELKKARERNKEGRTWLLIFLFGASMSLLFLDYYS